jgi:hypothetical protein
MRTCEHAHLLCLDTLSAFGGQLFAPFAQRVALLGEQLLLRAQPILMRWDTCVCVTISHARRDETHLDFFATLILFGALSCQSFLLLFFLSAT